ncbi:MAG: antitoxin Xre/MbcA/ParS toxin-binding domain-containing protein [Bacteroidota bacterium]
MNSNDLKKPDKGLKAKTIKPKLRKPSDNVSMLNDDWQGYAVSHQAIDSESNAEKATDQFHAVMLLLNKELYKLISASTFELRNKVELAKLSFIDFLKDKLLMVKVIKAGVPYPMFSLIQQITPFSQEDWADYLDLSGKSLGRYQQQNKTFKSIHSEKILELAEVTHLGLDVFGNAKKFRLWLDTPNYALGNNKPFELLKDSYGKDMVITELIHIEHGILS